MGFGADVYDAYSSEINSGRMDFADAVDAYNDDGGAGDFSDDFGDEFDFESLGTNHRLRARSTQTFDKRPGDWTCPKCGDHVFAPNDRCRVCRASRPSHQSMPTSSGTKRNVLGAPKVNPPGRLASVPTSSAALTSLLQSGMLATKGSKARRLDVQEASSSSGIGSSLATSSEVQVEKVLLRDRTGQPIDFGTDPDTTSNLLRAMGGFKQYLSGIVKQEVVKLEPGLDEDSIMPDDSASNCGNESVSLGHLQVAHPVGHGSSLSAVSVGSTYSEPAFSLVSAPSDGSQGRCFLAKDLLKEPDGRFVEVGILQHGSIVLASNGQPVEVKDIKKAAKCQQEVIELEAGAGSETLAILKVTPSHRVMVKRGPQVQTIPAGALKPGDQVLCSNHKLETLSKTQRMMEQVEIVDITFSPDLAVAAFTAPPEAILSKGHGWPKTTRRTKHRRSELEDNASMPDTEDSFR